LVLEGLNGIDRIGFSGPSYFHVGQAQSWSVGNGESEHFVSVCGRGQRSVSLVGWVADRNEQDVVQLELVEDMACKSQVTIVNGIETATENSQPHEYNGRWSMVDDTERICFQFRLFTM